MTFGSAQWDEGVLTANWSFGHGRALILLANLSKAEVGRPLHIREGRPIWGDDPNGKLPPWSVFWSVGGG